MNRTLAVLIGCLAGACVDAPADTFNLSLRFSPTPPSVGPARLLFEFTDSAGTPVTGAMISVLSPGGDQSPTDSAAPAHETAEGTYVVDGYQFTTAGSWRLEVEARTSEGLEVTRVFETPVYPGPASDSTPG